MVYVRNSGGPRDRLGGSRTCRHSALFLRSGFAGENCRCRQDFPLGHKPMLSGLAVHAAVRRPDLVGALASAFPEWPKSIIARHDSYWRGEANGGGNPMLALERGEKVLTPPAVWFQGRGDILHDYKDEEECFPGNEPQRFAANYRKAGGEITLEYIDAERHAGHAPDLSKTGDMFERMVAFVGNHTSARAWMPTDRTRRTDSGMGAFQAFPSRPSS